MAKVLRAGLVILALAPSAFAQIPSANVFVGYSYAHFTVPASPALAMSAITVPGTSTGLNGWNASVEAQLLPLLGIVADFSGHYGSQTGTALCGFAPPCTVAESINAMLYHFLVGPQVSFTVGRVRPFAHGLFGAGHLSEDTRLASSSTSDTAFAYAVGGGLDYRITGPLRWRLQGDLLHHEFFAFGQTNFRFSTGPVLHF
jgi:peptidoglycan-associated lipoprotein